MVTFDPDKKATKRTLLRRLFSVNLAADVRRARLDHRDLKTTTEKRKKLRSERAYIKQLKKDGTLK